VFEPVEEADDGLQSVRFRAAADLTPEAVATITEQVRIRMLRWFARSGLIDHLAAQLASGLAAAQAASASLPRRARPNSPRRAAAVVLERDLTDDPSASAEVPAPRPPRRCAPALRNSASDRAR
jgi:hypothetical protein